MKKNGKKNECSLQTSFLFAKSVEEQIPGVRILTMTILYPDYEQCKCGFCEEGERFRFSGISPPASFSPIMAI